MITLYPFIEANFHNSFIAMFGNGNLFGTQQIPNTIDNCYLFTGLNSLITKSPEIKTHPKTDIGESKKVSI